MTRRLQALSLLVLCLLLPSTSVYAWGKTGHAVIANIADEKLTPEARGTVNRLLDVEGAGRLSDISSWADKAKAARLPDTPSHSIRLPLNGEGRTTACPSRFCIVAGINHYSAILSDPKRSDEDRLVALKYVVHLVGDIHQPLHCFAPRYGHLKVVFGGKQQTLHRVWDRGILDEHGGGASRIARELESEHTDVSPSVDPLDWAYESRDVARDAIFRNLPLTSDSPIDLPADYSTTEWPIVSAQMRKAGIRLARLLNEALRAGG